MKRVKRTCDQVQAGRLQHAVDTAERLATTHECVRRIL